MERMNQVRTVSVYAVHIDLVRGTDLALFRERMPERAEKAGRFYREEDRLRCIGAGLLMMKAVGIRKESELRYGAYGKPFAPGYPGFNLSHSGPWCVLAMGEGDIGVDIEAPDEAHLCVAPMVYTPEEQAWMRESPLERFYMLWTWKESVMKAMGLGMKLEPGSFDVLPFTRNEPIALRGKRWYMKSGEMGGLRYSVCAAYPFDLVFYDLTEIDLRF